MKNRRRQWKNKGKQRRTCRLETLETRRVMTVVVDYFPISGVQDDYAVVDQSAETTIDVLANDFTSSYWRGSSQPDREKVNNSLTVEAAGNGTVKLMDDGEVLYTPDDDFTGIDRFKYTVEHDGETVSASVYVHVVNPVFAMRDWFSIESESQNNLLNVLENDIHGSDENSSLRIASVDAGDLDGTIDLSADGTTVIYTPGENAVGEQSFTYVLEDTQGNQSEATVYVEVMADSHDGTPSHREIEQRYLETMVDRYRTRFSTPQSWWSNRNLTRGHHLITFDLPVSNVSRVQSFQMQVPSLDASNVTFGVTGSSAGFIAGQTNGGVSENDSDTTYHSYSTTNNQETAVDEADLVKTDGEYLYAVSNWVTEDGQSQHQLVISDVRDRSQMTVVGRYGLDGPVENLFLSGDRVVVLTQNGEQTEVTVINVADRTSPVLDYETQWRGDLTQSRMVGDHVYVVAQTMGDHNLPAIEYVCYAYTVGCFHETVSQFVARAETQIRDTLNAEIKTTNADGTSSVTSLDSIAFVAGGQDLSAVVGSAVVSFDISGDQSGPADSISLMHGRDSNVYVSPESIFFFSSDYGNGNAEQLANTSDSFTKQYRYSTRIDQVSFDDQGDLQWVASGAVPGRALNSFSFSEHEGYLRIATNEGRSNSLYVLAQNGEQMELVGSVEDLAPNEQIYSVRFDGDRGFVVTFRKVDPLFVFDLSDPTTPTLLGELKVTGYSNYLEVLDENHVMGIGREANGSGLFQEMQISIFDISDLENPELKHRYSFDGGRNLWSPLMQDAWNLGSHQSVNYFGSHQTLVLPVYEGNGRWWSWNQSTEKRDVSMRVLDIDLESGISELGSVEFQDPIDPSKVRSVRIGDDLLSIAPGIVKANVLRSPDQSLGQLLIGAGANDDVFVVRGGSPAMIDVLANDSMINDTAPSVEIEQPIEGGTVRVIENGELEFTPQAEFIGAAEFSYRVGDVSANVQVNVKPQWHNSLNPEDVDGDGKVLTSDALWVINLLTDHGFGDLDKFDELALNSELDAAAADVNQDGRISAQDALYVINAIAEAREAAQPQAESPQSSDFLANQNQLGRDTKETDEAIAQLF